MLHPYIESATTLSDINNKSWWAAQPILEKVKSIVLNGDILGYYNYNDDVE